MAGLSVRDKAVLNCIFNPNLPLEDCYEEELNEDIKDNEIDSDTHKQATSLEIRAICEAENGELNEALDIFQRAMEIAPDKASLYNNRAQVYQLKGQITNAFDDLTKAIEMSGNNQNKTLCQALCQRGLIYRRWDKTELARGDFENAAKLGSKFAKSQELEKKLNELIPRKGDENKSYNHLNGTSINIILTGDDALRSQYVPPEPTVKILKRPTINQSSNDIKVVQPKKTLEQREQEYAKARLRILGEAACREKVEEKICIQNKPRQMETDNVIRLPKGPDGTNGFKIRR